MTRELERLRRRILESDGATIDELYGLEPVFEPGAGPGTGVQPVEFVAVLCPWCGERLETRVELTSGDTSYIEAVSYTHLDVYKRQPVTRVPRRW